MNSFALIVLLFGACAAQQQFRGTQTGGDIVITRSESDNDGAGNFKWLSETSDGTKLDQNGYLKDGPDPQKPIQVIQGSFSYIAPDGTPITLRYIADENGFQPQGDHIPASASATLRNAGQGRPAPPQTRGPAPAYFS